MIKLCGNKKNVIFQRIREFFDKYGLVFMSSMIVDIQTSNTKQNDKLLTDSVEPSDNHNDIGVGHYYFYRIGNCVKGCL